MGGAAEGAEGEGLVPGLYNLVQSLWRGVVCVLSRALEYPMIENDSIVEVLGVQRHEE